MVVISKEALKKEIFESACPQPQVIESSHLPVFASKTNIIDEYISEIGSNPAKIRNIPVAAFDGYLTTVKEHNHSLSESQRGISASRQACIALGTALVAAASDKIDATPIEGLTFYGK